MTTKYLGDGIWARRTNIDSADIMVPVERQAVYSDVIQTHNAVSVSASGSGSSAWYPCEGFNTIAVNVKSSISSGITFLIDWSMDGTTQHGTDGAKTMTGGAYGSYSTDVKGRYFRVVILNSSSSASTNTAYAYLKA